MSKIQARAEIYAEWDRMNEKMNERKKNSMFGILGAPRWDEAWPLMHEIEMSPRVAAGRNRRRVEELIVLPRFIVKFLVDLALQHIYSNDPEKRCMYEDPAGNHGQSETDGSGERS